MTRVRQNCPLDTRMSFVDSTGSVGDHSVTVTIVMAGTCVGALPIGMVLTGEKTYAAYSKAFCLLPDLITEDVDAGSMWNPTIVMTDNDSAIRNGLR